VKRVLAFFGAFNPLTIAHVEAARIAMEATGREGVVYVPSKAVYIRDEQEKDFAYSDWQRLEMLRRAAGSRPWMAVTDWELKAERQPRTYETLCHLRDEGYAPALLIGSDKLPELEHGWKHVGEIAREFGFVCSGRGTDECEAMIRQDPYLSTLSDYIQVVESSDLLRGVSSTGVRRRLSRIRALQREVQALVPNEVLPLLDTREENPSENWQINSAMNGRR
jgi:nicotinate (nicotinamide) nucleotide adenylyltransferase